MCVATKPIPVRIPEDWLPRIDAAAKRLGTNRARLIAFCAQTFAENFERSGVSSMPPNWEDILEGMDGRTTGAKNYSLNDKPNSKIVAAVDAYARKPVSYSKKRRVKKSAKQSNLSPSNSPLT